MSEADELPTEQTEVEQGLTDGQEADLNALEPDFVPQSEAAKEPPKNAQSVAMFSMVIGSVFNVLAVRLGDHWRLEQAEAKAIAEPAVAVLDKYFPEFETGPELALVAAVGMVVVPRAMTQKEIAEGGESGDQSESNATE